MDELELLKKDWKKEDTRYPKLSYNEIYKMILQKSSSIVKWIFIISLLEFALWTVISFALKDADFNKKFEEYHAENIMIPFMVLGYLILAYFFYKFFMNYKTISATDNAKLLMENILKTRRTVKHYVAFNLVYLAISVFLVLGIQFNRDESMIASISKASANGELFKFYAMTILVTLVALAVCIGVFLAFYYLIYGLLLKRLNSNYRELKKLET
jgi:cytochrome c oxidase assembly factor CtaG